MTREQAIALHDARFWEPMSHADRFLFQISQEKLCMPFSVFHEAAEKALGRPVFTHEFMFSETLKAEFLGERPAPALMEIINLLPADKRVIVAEAGA